MPTLMSDVHPVLVFPELTLQITEHLKGKVPEPYTVRFDYLRSRIEELGWVGLVVSYHYRGREWHSIAKGHADEWRDPKVVAESLVALGQSIARAMQRADRDAGEGGHDAE